ncbi:tellurium resistance protein TerY [Psittacicella melopsittaci]|uniref:Tellurium resistance protein TerY n=1 Tax=Psittacicella melopsittaci TaxID=2028576 RepID=A0A3A1Y6N5_9GAMM|nr:VWA domain-containing protein [Psittacicella melopsittaci]RIY31714.1 tellurium resistance protein TerY [Psittacicella melopsittaci]
MRRLPVYLLVDTSGSMMGEAIESVRNGLQSLVTTLRQDPYALETVYLSVITFSSRATQITPLTELISFQLPDIHASGLTAMGESLVLLADCINREVQKGTAEAKGDWKPVVFLLSDGAPTDDLQRGIDAIRQVKTGVFVACAAGSNADTDCLKLITEEVVSLDTADPNSIKAFFKWVSASISVSSQKVDLNKSDVGGLGDLPPPPPELNIVL